mgnify:FL=1
MLISDDNDGLHGNSDEDLDDLDDDDFRWCW